jgi:signal transduction histidine kinase
VSRIHGGRLDIEVERVDFREVVADVVDRFADELARASCTLVLQLDPSVVGVWDRMRLEQVLTNLLSNAIKFGAGRPIDIVLRSLGDQVRLQVRDRGIGIPPERQQQIFQRFERAAPSRVYGGLGLGLYIVRTIVEAMGGHIEVESQPGVGSTFSVTLPRRPAPVTAPSAADRKQPPDGRAAP